MYLFINNILSKTSCILRISGPDAYTYLQGQFTQELDRPIGSAAFGLWLNQKGKTLAESTILRLHDNDFILVGGESPASVIRERLESYLVADEVELADETSRYTRLILVEAEGRPPIESVMGPLPATGSFAVVPGGCVFRGRNSRANNLEIWIEAEEAMRLADRLRSAGAQEVDRVAIDARRIESGLATVPRDIGPGDLPNEGGLETEAISYTKGCFLGQEVMARLKNLGQVRRRLHVTSGPGECPAAGAPLFAADKKVGEFRSSAPRGDGFVAMAMLSLVNLDAKALARSAGGPAEVAIIGLAGSTAP